MIAESLVSKLDSVSKRTNNDNQTSTTSLLHSSTIKSVIAPYRIYCVRIMPLLMDDHRLDNNSEVIDLNRPLPQIPTQSSSRLHSKPSSKDIASSKPPEQPQSRHTRSFSTPTANIKKQNPLNLTCNSLHSSTPQYSPRTTDRFGLLDPVKYSPSEGVDKTSKMPGAYVIFELVHLRSCYDTNLIY